jgi:AraC-like DNA-binding protein
MIEHVPRSPQLLVHGAATTSVGAVRMAGHIPEGRGLRAKPLRVLASYALVYVLAGEGRYEDADGFDAPVGPGDLLLILPGVAHTYGPGQGQTWSEIYVVFDGSVFDLCRDAGLIDSTRPVRHLEPIDYWARLFEKITLDLHSAGPARALSNVCSVLAVLAEALAATEAVMDPDDRRWLARATALLDADIRREFTLQAIAKQLAISYDGFRKRFRHLAGVSPARYRSLRSIDRACELMAQGELSNRQIAADLGYSDEAHFSHRFSDLTGRTPSEFRSALPPDYVGRSWWRTETTPAA